MKYAVIEVGGQQQLVHADQELEIDLVTKKQLEFEPLLIFDEKTVEVGSPALKGMKVKAEVIDSKVAGQKLRIMKFKAKKRVKKLTGHRHKYSRIKITAI